MLFKNKFSKIFIFIIYILLIINFTILLLKKITNYNTFSFVLFYLKIVKSYYSFQNNLKDQVYQIFIYQKKLTFLLICSNIDSYMQLFKTLC